jgi:hypothetical protein
MASPFNLVSQSSVYASVVAINGVGSSPNSNVGNGAIIIVSSVPSAPVDLQRSSIVALDKTKISIVWSDGPSNGN